MQMQLTNIKLKEKEQPVEDAYKRVLCMVLKTLLMGVHDGPDIRPVYLGMADLVASIHYERPYPHTPVC